MVRAGKEETSTILEFWGEAGIEKELHVPEKLHGSVFVDGWFSTGASWDPDEQRIAYVAEVSTSQISNSADAAAEAFSKSSKSSIQSCG